MRLLFWISLLGIVYTYAAYPLGVWVVARLRPRPWKSAPVTPSLSIVLAVHNGAALLPRKLRHLLRLDYPNLREVIVVSDGSTDGTVEVLRRKRHPLLKSLVLPQHQGKAVALNAGMAAATGEVILFVDIRPEILPGAVRQLLSNFADPGVGCVSGTVLLRREGHDAAVAAVGGLYWRYEQWLRCYEARCAAPVGVYGGFYAVRRELAVPQPPGIILDDLFEPLAILRQGYRTVLDSEARVWDTWPKRAHGEFQRKVRTLAGNFQLVCLAPWVLTPQNPLLFQFFSHKLLRLVIPYLGLLLWGAALRLALGSTFYGSFAVLLSGGVLLGVSGLRFPIPGLQRLAGAASALLLLNAAAVAGLYRFLFTRGPLWKIWTSEGHGAPLATPATNPATNLAPAGEFDESLYAAAPEPRPAQERVAAV